jgi:hypothetical protein
MRILTSIFVAVLLLAYEAYFLGVFDPPSKEEIINTIQMEEVKSEEFDQLYQKMQEAIKFVEDNDPQTILDASPVEYTLSTQEEWETFKSKAEFLDKKGRCWHEMKNLESFIIDGMGVPDMALASVASSIEFNPNDKMLSKSQLEQLRHLILIAGTPVATSKFVYARARITILQQATKSGNLTKTIPQDDSGKPNYDDWFIVPGAGAFHKSKLPQEVLEMEETSKGFEDSYIAALALWFHSNGCLNDNQKDALMQRL